MKTKEEILKQMEQEMPFEIIGKGQMPYILEAMEIYAQQQIKNLTIPCVSGSFSAVECKDLMYYGTLKDGTVKLDDGTKHLDYFLLNIFDMAKDSTRFNVKEAVKMFWDRIEALANYR